MDKSPEALGIELPVKYWMLILTSLDGLVRHSHERAEELRALHIDLTTLPEAVVTALTGPREARDLIARKLIARGYLKEQPGSARAATASAPPAQKPPSRK